MGTVAKEHLDQLREHGYPKELLNLISRLTEDQVALLRCITVGPTVGQKFNPFDWANQLLPLGMALLWQHREQITDLRVWFDRFDGYNRLAFDLHGDHYEIQFFRAFEVIKNHCVEGTKTKRFSTADSVLTFFHANKHREWSVYKDCLTNFDLARVMTIAQQELVERYFGPEITIVKPQLFDAAGTIILGLTKGSALEWRIRVSYSGKHYNVMRPKHKKVGTALHFRTAMQYALTDWDWLGDC